MSKAGSMIKNLIIVILVSLPLIAAGAAAYFWFGMDKPYGNPGSDPIELVVERGLYFVDVASLLESEGLVANADYLYYRYRILSKLGAVGSLQAGRYALEPGSRPSELIDALTSPLGAHRVYTQLTIPPGLSARGMADRVENAGLAKADHVMEAVISLADEYPILENPEGLQGYLFPDTYKIEKPLGSGDEYSRSTAEEVVRTMADTFFKVLDDVDPDWSKLTRTRLHEKVSLASIVEREYRVQEEASKIAAVFNNRIADGHPLQSCATVVYVIEDTKEGASYQKEYVNFNRRIFLHYLEIESPFNTYLVPGLPPGPISLPGKTALEAAFYPADTDALFFVVKDPAAGTHVFTREYSDHLKAREAYLQQYVVKE